MGFKTIIKNLLFKIDWRGVENVLNNELKWKNIVTQNPINEDEHIVVTGEAQVNAFINWYKSSMQGRIYNERKILDNITLDYTWKTDKNLTKSSSNLWISTIWIKWENSSNWNFSIEITKNDK